MSRERDTTPERLAVLETRVDALSEEVSKMRASVDRLVTQEEMRTGRDKSRADMGNWIRWSPVMVGVVVALVNIGFIVADHLFNGGNLP